MIARPVIAVILVGLVLGPALAAGTSCPALALDIRGTDGTRELVCNAARATRRALSSCGLGWPEGTRIDVVDAMPDAPPGCLGRYDCETGEITVLSPGALAKRTDVSADFGDLGVEALFRSLIAHEISHAALDLEPGRPHGVATQEYVAYVMQLSVLTDADRQQVLARWPGSGPSGQAGLNGFILALSPGLFMSRTWHHFLRPENGCGFIRKVADGAATLDVPDL